MIKFYVTNQFVDKNNKLVTANQIIVVSEDRVENLTKKNFGYAVGKVETTKEEVKNKNLIGKK